MKIRAIAAATAALVVLAACGPREDSMSAQRTKNGALIPTTMPQYTPIDNQLLNSNGNNILLNDLNNNSNNPTTTTPSNLFNNNILDNNLNNLNSTSTTQSNFINKTCAQGGSCVVGDTGPGGGIVFYAALRPQTWGQYMEVSKTTLDPRFDTMWCDVPPALPAPGADALGNGRKVTEFYAIGCTRGQVRLAADLVQGGYDDWSLPTLADARELYKTRNVTNIDGQWHYTATPNFADGKREAFALYMVDGQERSMNPLAGFAGRAIRYFGTKASTLIVVTGTPTTFPAPSLPPPTNQNIPIPTMVTTTYPSNITSNNSPGTLISPSSTSPSSTSPRPTTAPTLNSVVSVPPSQAPQTTRAISPTNTTPAPTTPITTARPPETMTTIRPATPTTTPRPKQAKRPRAATTTTVKK